MIGDVEDVRAQLEGNPLKARVLDRRKIAVEKPRAAQSILADVAVGSDRVQGKVDGIDPLADHARMRTVAKFGSPRCSTH